MVNYLDTALRTERSEVPQPVRLEVERLLGDVVCSAVDQRGGFGHGVAVRVRTGGGEPAFVKAIEAGDELAQVYRQEAHIASRLPATAPAPRCRFVSEIAGWFVAGFDDVEGAFPRLDEPGELRDTLALVTRLATELTPSPLSEVPTVADAYGPQPSSARSPATGQRLPEAGSAVRPVCASINRCLPNSLESGWRVGSDGNSPGKDGSILEKRKVTGCLPRLRCRAGTGKIGAMGVSRERNSSNPMRQTRLSVTLGICGCSGSAGTPARQGIEDVA
ncbi:hypothetical protein [Nocardia arthritidis]|uniref:hypothetical protein n=1 Tax=Nocardia arthritidis TaxID=228602 RepID=UPI0007A51469|nr:hypothetical protein [Nocardia arthritidis]